MWACGARPHKYFYPNRGNNQHSAMSGSLKTHCKTGEIYV